MADKKVKPVTPAPVVVEPVEPTPADIKDKLQTMKNEKAAKQYETNKTYAKGGVTRGDGCAIRGKTKGRMV